MRAAGKNILRRQAPDRDTQREIVRKFVDSFHPPNYPSAKEWQQLTTKDREAQGPLWVSRVASPAPHDSDLLAHVLEAIARLGSGQEVFALPHLHSVSGEWIGSRHHVSDRREPEPKLSEREKYNCLLKDNPRDLVIFYIHGGAYATGSPTNTRPQASKLSELTKGRCFSLRYRLAPQFPAPAQLVDAFVAYLHLLHPPLGAYHDPVPATSIVFAGESCGGAIALAVVQIILQLQRQQSTHSPIIRFNGCNVSVPLPAGVTTLGLSGDVTNGLPSYSNAKNKGNDFMQDIPPHRDANGPTDDIWPTKPPRPELMCETTAMSHPILSPSIARDWTGAPPMWLACGEERMADCSKVLAQNAASQGVLVHFAEYELMPHIFAIFLTNLPQSEHCMLSWARAIVDFVDQNLQATKAVFIKAGKLEESDLDTSKLVSYTLDDAIALVKAKQHTIPPWTGPDSKL